MKKVERFFNGETYNLIRNKFDRLLKIYNSDLSDSQKIYEISKNYLAYHTMSSDFEFLKTYSKKDALIIEKEKNIKEMIDFFSKSSINTTSHYRYISENLDYYECYVYSKYVVSNFIDSKNIGLYEYCNLMGINYKDFLFCVKNIEELDVSLYEKLENTLYERKDIINDEKLNRINLMLYGIKNGKTIDGIRFDKAEFFKINPFTYDCNCIDAIKTFMEDNEFDPRDISSMNYYITRNNIRKSIMKNKFNYLNTKSFTTIIDGKILTDEDNLNIYNYMIENDYPQVSAVFSSLRERYINGELHASVSNKKKVLLIPNN